MMVYAPDLRLIRQASSSSGGRISSTRKFLIDYAHDGPLTTTMTVACWGTTASSISASGASCISVSTSKPPTAPLVLLALLRLRAQDLWTALLSTMDLAG